MTVNEIHAHPFIAGRSARDSAATAGYHRRKGPASADTENHRTGLAILQEKENPQLCLRPGSR